MKKFLLFVLVGIILAPVIAYTFSRSNIKVDTFEVWEGDYNGDGHPDLYLKAKQRPRMIGDSDNPLSFMFYDSPSLLLPGNAAGHYDQHIIWPHKATTQGARRLDYLFHVGDFNGDGVLDLIAQAPTGEYITFVLYGSKSKDFSTRDISTINGHNLAQDQVSIRVPISTNDSFDDIVITYGSNFASEIFSGAIGKVAATEAFVIKILIKMAWMT